MDGKLSFGSLFAGIGGFDEGLRRAGLQATFAVEIDKTCNSIRRRHFPTEEQHTDVTAFSIRSTAHRPDLICGGFPCQDLSVAGKRAGLSGERSGLFFEFMRIVGEFAPTWVLIENVYGLLSSNGGRDMGTVLRTLAELGYGTAYRVLDSQWFGVPQGRRRVFIVGCLGDWRRAAEVLFEPESLPWDIAPSRKAGAGVARSVAACLNSGGNNGGFRTEPGEHLISHPLLAKPNDSHDESKQTYITGTLCAPYTPNGHGARGPTLQDAAAGLLIPMSYAIQERAVSENLAAGPGGKGYREDVAYTLEARAAGKQQAVAYQCHGTNVGPMGTLRQGNGNTAGGVPFVFESKKAGEGGEISPTLRSMGHDASHANAGGQLAIQSGMAVRRLLPVECEKLQGFPPCWTRYCDDGTEIADGPRYRMLGNAVTVNVAEWLGCRIIAAS